MPGIRRLAAAAVLTGSLAGFAGCYPVGGDSPSPTSPPIGTTPPAAPAASDGLAPDHIVVILEENKPADRIFGSDEAPYLNELARTYAVTSNYSAISNPSLPNYIALTSGTTAGITSDCSPAECAADIPNLADRVEDAGRTWRIYGEGMPAPCATSNSGKYAVKHIPFVYYKGITSDSARCRDGVVPYPQLAADLASGTLPDLVFITPDLCNDMHDCSIGTGDAWLAREVPAILESPAFGDNSLLVVTFDEGNKQDNTVTTVFAGPAARTGFTSDVAYSHYSLLHTIESLWNLEPLTDNDRNAAVMTDMLQPR
jgi:phospholipase C